MPLIKSASDKARSENISEMVKSGHPQNQAIAAAYDVQRKAKKRADGGSTFDDRWSSLGGVDTANPSISNPGAIDYFVAGAKDFANDMVNAAKNRADLSGQPSFTNRQRLMDASNLIDNAPEQAKGGAIEAARGIGRAMGGPPPMPWYSRHEATGMTKGPILSAVAGRHDSHSVRVPSASYILPADHVSAMGEGNTLAGVATLNRMFGGPFGKANIKHGSGAPNPPHGAFSSGGYDKGGARGHEGIGHPTDVMLSGGEYSIPPEALIAKFGDIHHAHKVLDAWVRSTRKKHIKTLSKLPGPAKD